MEFMTWRACNIRGISFGTLRLETAKMNTFSCRYLIFLTYIYYYCSNICSSSIGKKLLNSNSISKYQK